MTKQIDLNRELLDGFRTAAIDLSYRSEPGLSTGISFEQPCNGKKGSCVDRAGTGIL